MPDAGAMRTVTLTDEAGNDIGTCDVLEAHTGEGKLHRAFSVYVFRSGRREILIQRRSGKKMLWPMIWANTCCSQPFENESAIEAGTRRLREEFGFECPLREDKAYVYRAVDPRGAGVEHEHVTMLTGDDPAQPPNPDPEEIAEWKWIDIDELRADMATHPDAYAPWFHLGLKLLLP